MRQINIGWLEEHLQSAVHPQLKVENVKLLGGGCINSASKVSTSHGAFFAKWNFEEPKDLFLREAESLESLKAAGTSLQIPSVLLKTLLSLPYPALLVTEFLHLGSPNDQKLGEGLAELHYFTNNRFGFAHNNYCGATLQDNQWQDDWSTFYRDQRIGHLIDLLRRKRALPISEEKAYKKFMEKLPDLLPKKPPASLVHGDLWSGNFMHTVKGPALIDSACCYADREYEFGITTMFGGFSTQFWEAYQANYPLSSNWHERNLIYQLYHYLNHFYLFGGGYGRSALQIAKRFI